MQDTSFHRNDFTMSDNATCERHYKEISCLFFTADEVHVWKINKKSRSVIQLVKYFPDSISRIKHDHPSLHMKIPKILPCNKMKLEVNSLDELNAIQVFSV